MFLIIKIELSLLLEPIGLFSWFFPIIIHSYVVYFLIQHNLDSKNRVRFQPGKTKLCLLIVEKNVIATLCILA